jgi:hypothetical protein
MVGRMDELYFYVARTDRLLEQGIEHVMSMFEDSKIPHMELLKLNVSKADKQWLNHEYAVSYVVCQHIVSYSVLHFSEFNKENKMDQRAKSSSSEKVTKAMKRTLSFWKNLMNQRKRNRKRKEMSLK